MSSPLEPLDDMVADPLVMGVLRGERVSWFQLTLSIESWVAANAPRNRLLRRARLATSEDDVRDVMLATLERVARDDFRALRSYLEGKRNAIPDVRTTPERACLSFGSWLAGLVDFAIRDHVRRRYGRPVTLKPGQQLSQQPLTKRSVQSWAVRTKERAEPPFVAHASMTRLLTARSILKYAADSFEPHELRVLRRYLEQASYEELAQELGLAGPAEARVEVRKLKERLRVRFRSSR